ncbi:hypothetical protein TTHERM_00641260 (macronuclear) [Tetrahymena thermophila SB210]|uniref:Uncharacterized protein n=1 Tax=Tetrahymena thermophila (strain SB210) TaxID=312017 RepID=Q23F07_TETTS|nr:hypothetical protein TTHERM_00641260 [Tetrahymena thermophila SB210]EAR95098.2 hypothetical protein TTHERM_00641260 [Tetrahymena thermophila SB210]|eukprot:XP_001015343.2 hypothetical protein TTHERM_00641260 [Tetrahymena thermophila SB210]
MKQVNQSTSPYQHQIDEAIQLCQFIRDYKLKNDKKIKDMNLSDRIKIENIPNLNLEGLTIEYLKQLNNTQFSKIQSQLQKIVDMLMEQEFAIDRDIKNQKSLKQIQLNDSFQSQYSSVNSSFQTNYSSVRRSSAQQFQNDFYRQKNINNEENYSSKRCLDSYNRQEAFTEVMANNNNKLKSIDNLYQNKKQCVSNFANDTKNYDTNQFKAHNYSSQYNSVNNQSRRVSIIKINDLQFSDNEEEKELKNIQPKEDPLDKLILKVNEEKDRVMKLLEKEKKERQSLQESQQAMNYQSISQLDYQDQLYIKEQQIAALAKEINQLKQENFNLKNSNLMLRKDKTELCPNKNNAFSYVLQNCQIISAQENNLIFKWAFDSQIDLCKLLNSAISIQAEREKGKEAKQIEQFYQSIIQMENFEQLLENCDENNLNFNDNHYTEKLNPDIQSLQNELQELKSKLDTMQQELNERDYQIDLLNQQIAESTQKFNSEKTKYQNEMKYIKRQQRDLEIQQNILKLEREKFEQEQNEKKQLEELEKMQNDLTLLSQF